MAAVKVSRLPIADCNVMPTHSPPLTASKVEFPIQAPATWTTDGADGEAPPHEAAKIAKRTIAVFERFARTPLLYDGCHRDGIGDRRPVAEDRAARVGGEGIGAGPARRDRIRAREIRAARRDSKTIEFDQ